VLQYIDKRVGLGRGIVHLFLASSSHLYMFSHVGQWCVVLHGMHYIKTTLNFLDYFSLPLSHLSQATMPKKYTKEDVENWSVEEVKSWLHSVSQSLITPPYHHATHCYPEKADAMSTRFRLCHWVPATGEFPGSL
jgi:hypothetical protein